VTGFIFENDGHPQRYAKLLPCQSLVVVTRQPSTQTRMVRNSSVSSGHYPKKSTALPCGSTLYRAKFKCPDRLCFTAAFQAGHPVNACANLTSQLFAPRL
jgi:hypothetical protein